MAGLAEFGALIKSAREQRGWTGVDLANRIDRPHSFVVRIERGQNANAPDPSTFWDLASALQLDPERMLVALGYLSPNDADAEPWDAKMPPVIREALADIDWQNPSAITQALVVLNLIRDAQRSGNQLQPHDPREVDRKPKS